MSKARDAASDFALFVVPELERYMHGTYVQTEERPSWSDLDITAGIDGYLKYPKWIEGVAARVQYRHYGNRDAPWARGASPQTFTCRTATEIPKRIEAIRNGALLPTWTIQAYMDSPGGPCENWGIIPTVDLYWYVDDNGYDLRTYTNPEDGTRFVAVPWKKVSGMRWFRQPSVEARLF